MTPTETKYALGVTAIAPDAAIIDAPNRRVLRALLGVLIARPRMTREVAFITLYGERPDGAAPSEKMVDVYLVHLRRYLRGRGVTLQRDRQRDIGCWYLAEQDRAALALQFGIAPNKNARAA